MPIRLNTNQKNFEQEFNNFLCMRANEEQSVQDIVRPILCEVKAQGDAALMRYTKAFDRFNIEETGLSVRMEEVANAIALCSPELMKSLKMAASRIRAYSERQLPTDEQWTDELGVTLGWRWGALDSAGLYVPGGTAAYPSSVLMNAIPAKVAGVKRLVVVVPTPDGVLNHAVLAACHVAGVDEIYRVGGAQAVAALAYGTSTIAAVDKIVGPGNAYVAEAKRQVFGKVGIDMIAGPSEILVVADAANNPQWIVADLLSQAEHDAEAQSILITDDADFARTVELELAKLLETLPRCEIASRSWERYGAVIVVESLVQAIPLINAIAAEHLELAVADPQVLAAQIRHAGAIFLGRHTPEAIGDYVAGPSHVLPTSRTARFSSGLSVFDFLKRTSIVGCTSESLPKLADYAWTLAQAEGLEAHAYSLAVRREG